MLDTIPHDQAFSQLIITQMVTYHDKCREWYRGTLSYDPLQPIQRSDRYMEAIAGRIQSKETGGSRLKMAAVFAQSGELRDIATSLWSAGDEGEDLLEKVSCGPCVWTSTHADESGIWSFDCQYQ